MNSVNRKKNTATISATSRQNARSASGEFAPILRRVCIAAWILKLIPIPIGLWNARLLSRTVTGAVSGDSESVLRTGAVLLLLLALTKAFDFATCLRYRKAASQALHRCRLLLYRRFLSCPLSALYGMEHGQAVELLNDDFDTVTGKTLRLYPRLFHRSCHLCRLLRLPSGPEPADGAGAVCHIPSAGSPADSRKGLCPTELQRYQGHRSGHHGPYPGALSRLRHHQDVRPKAMVP